MTEPVTFTITENGVQYEILVQVPILGMKKITEDVSYEDFSSMVKGCIIDNIGFVQRSDGRMSKVCLTVYQQPSSVASPLPPTPITPVKQQTSIPEAESEKIKRQRLNEKVQANRLDKLKNMRHLGKGESFKNGFIYDVYENPTDYYYQRIDGGQHHIYKLSKDRYKQALDFLSKTCRAPVDFKDALNSFVTRGKGSKNYASTGFWAACLIARTKGIIKIDYRDQEFDLPQGGTGTRRITVITSILRGAQ